MKRWNPCRPCCPTERDYDPCFACGNCPEKSPDSFYGKDAFAFEWAFEPGNFGIPTWTTRYPFPARVGTCFGYTGTFAVVDPAFNSWGGTYTVYCRGGTVMASKSITFNGVAIYFAQVEMIHFSCAPFSGQARFPAMPPPPAFSSHSPWPEHTVYFADTPFT